MKNEGCIPAQQFNCSFTQRIISESINGTMLYISTDYVFDGKSPPFAHDDPTNPLNEYGRMKRDGENEVLKVDKG